MVGRGSLQDYGRIIIMTRLPKWSISQFDFRKGKLPEEWQQLNDRCCHSHPLLTPLFLEPLLRTFGRPGLYLARLNMDGDYRGLALIRRVRAGHWALFQPSQAPLGPIMIDQAACEPSVALRSLITSLSGSALELDLTFLDPDYSPIPDQDAQAEAVRHAVTMGVNITGDFEHFWSSRKRQLRYNLRHYLKQMEEENLQPTMEIVSDAALMDEAVDAYGDLETAGWKGRQGTAIHRSNAQGAVYRDIMRGHAERGQGVIHRMMINDRLAACWMIIKSGGMAVMLKTTFDENLSSYAVGRVVLYKSLQLLFNDSDIKTIEFYTNANEVQLQWGNISRPIWHVNYYRHPLVRRARQVVRKVRQVIRPILPAKGE